jgi:phosphatidate cytidylyltransferase
MKREITGLILIALLVLSIEIPTPILFLLLVFLASLLAYREIHGLASAKGLSASWPAGLAFSWALILSFYVTDVKAAWIIAAALFFIPLLYLRPGSSRDHVLAETGIAIYAILYTGLLLGYMLGLRLIGGDTGRHLLYFLFLVVCGGDTGAYYLGKAFGRHKLAPVISPNKTIEGAAAGLASSVLLALAAKYTFFSALSAAQAVCLALVLGVIAQLSDLIESVLKRSASIKDSASFLPGHGGMLDRLDSLAFAGPVLYYFYLYGLSGQAS